MTKPDEGLEPVAHPTSSDFGSQLYSFTRLALHCSQWHMAIHAMAIPRWPGPVTIVCGGGWGDHCALAGEGQRRESRCHDARRPARARDRREPSKSSNFRVS